MGIEVSDRLVFDTSYSVGRRTAKNLSALNHYTGRFITVEGPPVPENLILFLQQHLEQSYEVSHTGFIRQERGFGCC